MKRGLVIGLAILTINFLPMTTNAQGPARGAEIRDIPECSQEIQDKILPIIKRELPEYGALKSVCEEWTDYTVRFAGEIKSTKGNPYRWIVTVSFNKDFQLFYRNILWPTEFVKLVDFIENQPVYTQRAPKDINFQEIGAGTKSTDLNGVFVYGTDSTILEFIFDENNTLAVFDIVGPGPIGGSSSGKPITVLDLNKAGLTLKTGTIPFVPETKVSQPVTNTPSAETGTSTAELQNLGFFSKLVSALKDLVGSFKNLFK